jgi:Restriction endonuclease/Topoisomerase DNA binding C4 zinc finger
MARRRRQPDTFEFLLELVVPVVGLILLLGLLAPLLLKALVQLVLTVVICVVIVLVLFFVIRSFVENGLARPESTPMTTIPPGEPTRASRGVVKIPIIEEKLRAIDWFQFEKMVSAIYEVRGCKVQRLGGAKPDGGIDLIVEKDGERLVVQCKHWRKWTVGIRHIRELLGTLKDANIEKGVLVTLRGCTAEAMELANKHDIHIVDEAELVGLMHMADGSVDGRINALLDDDRKYCPKCEAPLVLRTATKGFNQGGRFWGCSNYPRCRYILRNA